VIKSAKMLLIMLTRFHTIPERDRRTDRRMDGRTDRIPIAVSRVAIDKKIRISGLIKYAAM